MLNKITQILIRLQKIYQLEKLEKMKKLHFFSYEQQAAKNKRADFFPTPVLKSFCLCRTYVTI